MAADSAAMAVAREAIRHDPAGYARLSSPIGSGCGHGRGSRPSSIASSSLRAIQQPALRNLLGRKAKLSDSSIISPALYRIKLVLAAMAFFLCLAPICPCLARSRSRSTPDVCCGERFGAPRLSLARGDGAIRRQSLCASCSAGSVRSASSTFPVELAGFWVCRRHVPQVENVRQFPPFVRPGGHPLRPDLPLGTPPRAGPVKDGPWPPR